MPDGLAHYEFRPLPDGSGVQVSQSGKALQLDWAAALNLGAALIDAYRTRAEESARFIQGAPTETAKAMIERSGKRATDEAARQQLGPPKRARCGACGVEWPEENHRCALASPMETGGPRRW